MRGRGSGRQRGEEFELVPGLLLLPESYRVCMPSPEGYSCLNPSPVSGFLISYIYVHLLSLRFYPKQRTNSACSWGSKEQKCNSSNSILQHCMSAVYSTRDLIFPSFNPFLPPYNFLSLSLPLCHYRGPAVCQGVTVHKSLSHSLTLARTHTRWSI